MKQHLSRIANTGLVSKITNKNNAASLIKNGMVVASSGFTKSGDSKAVLLALSERAEFDPLKITLITGALIIKVKSLLSNTELFIHPTSGVSAITHWTQPLRIPKSYLTLRSCWESTSLIIQRTLSTGKHFFTTGLTRSLTMGRSSMATGSVS